MFNNNKKPNIDHNGLKMNLEKFIDAHKCNSGDKTFTHTNWDGKRNFIFKIEDEEYNEFLELYISEAKDNFGRMHILEKPMEWGPLCLDFDFNYSQDDEDTSEKIFRLKHITKIIEEVNNVLRNCYEISEDQEELIAYVLLKENATLKKVLNNEGENKYIFKDGFHIQYPKIILSYLDKFLIYDQVLKAIKKNGILKDLELTNTIEEAFDTSVIKKNSWFMFGSGKNNEDGPQYYNLRYIINHELKRIKATVEVDDLIKLLAIRKTGLEKTKANEETCELYDNINKKYRVNRDNKDDLIASYMIKNTDNEVSVDTRNNLDAKITNIRNEEKNALDNNIDTAKKYLAILDKRRSYDYNEWIQVGWALYNTSPTLLNDFITFSKQDKEKYKPGCCEKVWLDCRQREERDVMNTDRTGYTIASLSWWAKKDNPIKWYEIIQEKVNVLLEKADTKTDYDVASVIFEMYKDEFRCSDVEKGIWWQFENHRWRKIDGAYTLSLKMSEDVSRELATLQNVYVQQSVKETGFKSDLWAKKAANIFKLMQELKKGPTKDRLIKECSKLFYRHDPKFRTKLDDNHYLIGFDNGVYDLKANVFRSGSPDDYICKSTGYNYREYNMNQTAVKEVMTFYSQIQPEKEMRDFLLYHSCSLLDGYNKDQKFVILTGQSGSNGKSTHIDLMTRVLGEYSGTLPVSLLTQKRKSSSAASPEMANKQGVRLCSFQEPEQDDQIYVGQMKELTGQDKIMARGLYENPFEFIPQFKLVLCCNELPKVTGADGGTWRRVRAVPFEQKFCANPQLPNEHKIDPELREKLKNWVPALAWLLLTKYYPEYRKLRDLDEVTPDKVKVKTSQYQADSNIYLEFMEQCIEVDKQCYVEMRDLWGSFCHWYDEAYQKKPPIKKKLLEFLRTNNYKIKEDKVIGIKEKHMNSNSFSLPDIL